VAQPTAEELLARANDARRARRYDEAERTYRTLQRMYGSSREAAVSRVTLGRLLLSSRGDAAGALEQFDHYLRAQPAGVLAEEARVGRAMSLEHLGRTEDARAAWRDLLASHPDSLHADRARRASE
jgi:TolA-binding protein